jgi:hypothetical protein
VHVDGKLPQFHDARDSGAHYSRSIVTTNAASSRSCHEFQVLSSNRSDHRLNAELQVLNAIRERDKCKQTKFVLSLENQESHE